MNSSEAAHTHEQPGLTPALAFGLTAYSLVLVAALTFMLHRPIVSCKSAKDRTSMSVTAEQVALLRRRHELPETEAQPLLDAMRRDGVRMQNTFKNVGKAGYAFNALQRLLLPASLRAPKDTTVSGLEA